MTKEEIIEVIHKTMYQFFDVCGDNEEVPMSDKDELLLEVNKAICNNIIKASEESTSDDVKAIHTQGLDEGIRCAMCTNSMRNDKGCDGGCIVNENIYKEVMNTIRNHIVPSVTPTQDKGKWILTDVEKSRVWHCNCSKCGKDPQNYVGGSENWWLIKNHLPEYCPHCGSPMESE